MISGRKSKEVHLLRYCIWRTNSRCFYFEYFHLRHISLQYILKGKMYNLLHYNDLSAIVTTSIFFKN